MPLSMRSSISSTSSVTRAITSPSLSRSKKASESLWRCAKNSVLRETMKRPPTQSERYSSQNVATPSASCSPM